MPLAASALATSAGPIRRSGAPNATSRTPATTAPMAKASTSSIGRMVPVITRTSAAEPSTIHAARRQERASQGATVTVTATAPARTRGLGNPAFVTNASRARLVARSGGTEYPRRRSSAANTTPAKTAPPTSVVRRRKRRRRNSTATTAAIAATATTWSRPVRSSPGTVSGSSPDTVAARERSRRPATLELARDPESTTQPRRTRSPS